MVDQSYKVPVFKPQATHTEPTMSSPNVVPQQAIHASTPGGLLRGAAVLVRRLPARPFPRGNTLGRANRGRRPANPVACMQRQCRRVYADLQRGKIESHVANALINCLKFQVELL